MAGGSSYSQRSTSNVQSFSSQVRIQIVDAAKLMAISVGLLEARHLSLFLKIVDDKCAL